jgi:hypothetical protein
MSKQAEADLILKLYELRREDTMRKARDWCFREFNPQSFDDVKKILMGEHSAYVRMVTSYWDMAAALVNHGAISLDMFTDTNGEHYSVYAMMEPFLKEMRAAFGPYYLANLEKLVDAAPNGRERVAAIRQRMQAIRAARTASR